MLPTILFYAFVVTVIFQFFYWIFFFGRFAFSKVKTQQNHSNLPVSILIAAKNEAQNLEENLPKILEQDYTDFEVIVINDASTDSTIQVIKNFQKEYKNLESISLEATKSYAGNKKNAITKGVAMASNEYLLFTDADCVPVSQNWISEMVSQLNIDVKIILGYGAYKKRPSFINKLIRYETLLTAIQYFSYAKAGLPYMGVGRNLSYKKELFKQAQGFQLHIAIKSGDDDLFINQIATKKNTAINFSKDSFTISEPKISFTSWFQQKRRHISTAHHYRPIHQFLLGLFYTSQLLFWLLTILLLTFSLNWQFVIPLIIIRFIAQYFIISKSASKLHEQDLVIFTPVLDFLLVITQLGLFFSNLIQKPKHW